MATLTVGRVAMKIAGREAGKYCVVLTNPKDNFVQITGPKFLTGVKRRRCNVDHLEPSEHMVKIDADAADKVVMDTLEKDGLVKKLGLKKPSPEVVKGPEMKGKKEEKPKEEKKVEPKKEEAKEEKKPEGRTITISLPRLGRKKEEPKPEKKPAKKKVEKKAEKPKKKSTKKK